MKISDLPHGSAPEALKYPFFPAQHLAVIWHNWNLVHPAKIAEVLQTTEQNIITDAKRMGLVRNDAYLDLFAARGYLTILRTNWHLLDYDQMLQLLDWTPEHLAFTLKEDDFFWVKVGFLKPRCGTVSWRELTPEELRRTEEIAMIANEIRNFLPESQEPPFQFLKNYGNLKPLADKKSDDGLRLIYSYSAVYGDPFLDEKIDPYPEGLLKDYAAAGVNAVWLPGLLYTLIPWMGDFEISKNWEKRLVGVRRLADRCAKYGIRLYLYLNEPRCVPEAVAKQTPWAGVTNPNDGSTALCPWSDGLCDALSKGIERLCREVPTLGGFFTITMSENLTHCLSRPYDPKREPCPRCASHTPADNVTKVLSAIYKGIQDAGSDARIIAWSWAWQADWAVDVLKQLPKDISMMCVSENNVETDCFGQKSAVFDYSISKPGPGPDAKLLWGLARKTGHPCVAKIQINTTWEMSAIPAIPVPFLIEKHIQNLRKEGIRDFMLSWTHGGVPGGNLNLLDMSVKEYAEKLVGSDAPAMLEIWKIFSDAFARIPFDSVNQIYFSPINIGPANLLFENPTGYSATMVRGFPYDDLKGWRSIYTEDNFERIFLEISEAWKAGLDKLQKLAEARKTPALKEQLIFAETAWTCLRSTYLQTRFVRLRDAGKKKELKPVIQEEELLVRTLLKNFVSDSRIGFEAANHYYYTVNELVEKILCCRYLAAKLCSLPSE